MVLLYRGKNGAAHVGRHAKVDHSRRCTSIRGRCGVCARGTALKPKRAEINAAADTKLAGIA